MLCWKYIGFKHAFFSVLTAIIPKLREITKEIENINIDIQPEHYHYFCSLKSRMQL